MQRLASRLVLFLLGVLLLAVATVIIIVKHMIDVKAVNDAIQKAAGSFEQDKPVIPPTVPDDIESPPPSEGAPGPAPLPGSTPPTTYPPPSYLPPGTVAPGVLIGEYKGYAILQALASEDQLIVVPPEGKNSAVLYVQYSFANSLGYWDGGSKYDFACWIIDTRYEVKIKDHPGP